jgi:cystathionine beta-lyase/cystathionine gamma-synthase
MSRKYSIDTRAVHAGKPDANIEGAVVMPVFQTAMYETVSDEDYHDIRYLRLNNSPNHLLLHDKLASLENAEAGLVTASGMAAISTALLTILGAGDHLIAQDVLYGGTHSMVNHDFPKLGIQVDFIDGADPDSWKSKLKPNTKAVYVETISNPLIGVPELKAVPEFARANGLVSLIDNTFASPVNFRPAEHGYDISLHSATKYLNGHTDIVAGAVVGRADLVEQVRHKLNHLGGSLDPHACFLLNRGLLTLPLRIARQNESALRIARFLDEHPAVARVNYAGLVSSPQHQRAKAALDG